MKDAEIDLLIKKMLSGDKLALAKVITIVENQSELTPTVMSKIYPHTGRSYQIGFTGPPGAGKSTLVDRLIPLFRKENHSIGVIAVDPSSPFSGGAVLGDRIRMQQHCLDDAVFIRSLGTRGSQGGLSRTTKGIIQLFDASGKNYVLIETVGVGQTELSVKEIADTTIVVLVPESGDAIQTMKAGLMEIADIFVVNKSDREGAEAILTELRLMAHLSEKKGDWEIPILLTQANKDVGITELFQQIKKHRTFL
ncbi:MAG: methylmalonyl Co-A mutase-associated GTPase MeaB, partial [Deltaproteobacteria bacterium]